MRRKFRWLYRTDRVDGVRSKRTFLQLSFITPSLPLIVRFLNTSMPIMTEQDYVSAFYRPKELSPKLSKNLRAPGTDGASPFAPKTPGHRGGTSQFWVPTPVSEIPPKITEKRRKSVSRPVASAESFPEVHDCRHHSSKGRRHFSATSKAFLSERVPTELAVANVTHYQPIPWNHAIDMNHAHSDSIYKERQRKSLQHVFRPRVSREPP